MRHVHRFTGPAAGLLVLLMLLTGVTAGCARAAETALATDGIAQQKLLKRIVADAEKKIDIPAELDVFSYTLRQEATYQNPQGLLFDLRWTDASERNSLNMVVNAEGEIIELRRTRPYAHLQLGSNRFPKLSTAEAEVLAREQLDLLVPELKGQIAAEAQVRLGYSSSEVVFQRTIEGIPVFFTAVAGSVSERLSLGFDPDTQELGSFYRNWYVTEFEKRDSPKDALDPEEALAALLREVGLKLHYVQAYGEKEAFLEYAWNETASPYIDAHSGKLFVPPAYDSMALYSGGGKGGAGGGAELSQQEQQRIEALAGLLSAEEALARLNSLPHLPLDERFRLTESRYYLNAEAGDREEVTLALNDETGQRMIHARLDARTGELLSLYGSSFSGERYRAHDVKVAREQAEKVAAEFLTAVQPERADQWALSSEYMYEDPSIGSHLFIFHRMVQGIPFEQDSFTVQVDKKTGLVVSFFGDWQKDLVFADAEELISSEEAFRQLAAQAQPQLRYLIVFHQDPLDAQTGSYRYLYDAKLVYALGDLARMRVDARSGEVKSFSYSTNASSFDDEESYVDVAESAQRQKIRETMAALGYPHPKQFRPDETIEQIEWLRWMMCLNGRGWYDESDEIVYEAMSYLSEQERQPQQELTLREALRHLVQNLHFEEYIALTDLYLNPYEATGEDISYLAIAIGHGLIDPEQDTDLDAPLSRLEAALLLYKLYARD